MNTNGLDAVFLMLVLPCFFALTMIAEGMWKIFKNESGWLPILMGIGFMLLFIFVYFLVIKSV